MIRSVTIVGAGPAGLSAARALRQAGLRDVLVIERNPEAGGLPRFCAHPGWGMLDRGAADRSALRRRAGAPGPRAWRSQRAPPCWGWSPAAACRVSFPDGVRTVQSRAVLLATGVAGGAGAVPGWSPARAPGA